MRYLQGAMPARLAKHLVGVRRLRPGEVIVETDYDHECGACEYSVITSDDVASGIFSKIAGVLAGSGLQILDAQILTRADGIVIDTFHVTDLDYRTEPPAERRRTVGARITAVLKGWEDVDDVLRRGALIDDGVQTTMAITAEQVKQLRDKTGAGMMECKAALTEANGNEGEAITLLRKRGLGRRSDRPAPIVDTNDAAAS